MGVEILLNIQNYGRDYAEFVTKRIAKDVRKRAKLIVAKDTGHLKTTIRMERERRGTYLVYTDKQEAAYNFAQEFGRPDLKSYKYTPYMRPAAFQAGQPGNMLSHALAAHKEALKKNKRKGK